MQKRPSASLNYTTRTGTAVRLVWGDLRQGEQFQLRPRGTVLAPRSARAVPPPLAFAEQRV